LIGFFANILVLRADLSGDPSFRELLGRVRKVTLEAYAHQDLPFEKLVEELQPKRNLSYSPLFQVMFVLQNAPMTTLRFNQLAVTPLKVGGGTAKFDLTLSMTEETDSLSGSVEYSTDLFDGATIDRMMNHFHVLLEGIGENADQRLSDLVLLTDKERHQVLVEWNDTRKEYSGDRCVHELFEEQVERTPEDVAVRFGDQQLTYRELNRSANQLARYLRQRGVESETPVGLCVERSLEMVVALVGILKAGGTYVPLDPAEPGDRLAYILRDTQAPVLLTQTSLLERLPDALTVPDSQDQKSQIHNRRVVCLDTDWAVIAREMEDNPAGLTTPDNLAYVIYTSGTTGRPKGTMIAHRSVVNYLSWVNEYLLGGEIDGLPAISKLAFDASLKQLLAPLLQGREVWLVADEVSSEPAALLQAVGRRPKMGINCVPSFWMATLDQLNSSSQQVLSEAPVRLFLGGERLTKELIERSFAAVKHLKVWNLYGPTEATANVTVARISRGDEITIGRPIANTQVYVLDSRLQIVPVGVPGELHVGGVGVARGYLSRPDLTAQKFIPNVFSDEPGARLYRTGDLARYRPDGSIEFLGRLDDQVKIRGFRIELAEIETALGEHPGVWQAIVLVDNRTDGDTRLVAYVVPQQDAAPSTGDLRTFLKTKLPTYMVPSKFVSLNALPLAPNGKVDRGALPDPDGSRPEPERAFVAPRTPVEKRLAAIWAEVLKLKRIGIHDNFFYLGGHSLSAIQVISRVREIFRLEIFLRALFEKPTLAGFAETIVEAKNRHAQHSMPSTSAISPLPRQLQRLNVS
jgi:amino acid adenylation domain-containing protein